MSDTGNGLAGSFNDDLLRLEEIFLPSFFYKKMQYYFSSSGLISNDVLFVHYTSAESAFSIIRNKRANMCNAVHMSDYREVQNGFNFMDDFVSKKNKHWVKFGNIIEEFLPGVFDRSIKVYNDYSRGAKDNLYFLSVSEHDESENELGRLSMWRVFGGQSNHVAIVLRIPALSVVSQALGISFNPVLYAEKDQYYYELDEVIKNVKNNEFFLKRLSPDLVVNAIVSMILVNVFCIKHKGFQEEREWRCIYLPECGLPEFSSQLIESGEDEIAGFSQKICKMPLDSAIHPMLSAIDFCKMFDSLIIGPSECPDSMYEAFCRELTNIGVLEAESKVRVSGIPVR
ncbi:conserved hypothetical protein [Chlorobaculum parvum NCIB 8327]|uniref:DUF2971 domain-containing protein n=1 Tax=Chlorobaculum parvum (strain DSM 263 / NCIMB 8327) TaxID=517417 RepID=B3QPR2_CHLP8|nr:DUF2971 domain-containing protein [Chlorobaculum parvum]ACF11915.1 conserved hypothetical protein [Chlorobaculum parvum NCIB 8327]